MTAEPSVARLVTRARSGDEDALRVLFERYADDVYDTALRLTGSSDDADDVLQNVFIGLPEALAAYSETGSLGAWIRKVAHRTALGFMRRYSRLNQREERFARLNKAEQAPARVEAKLALEWALKRMPDDLRVVYVLKEIEGYSHDEIAEAVGISANNSAARLYRARAFLKDCLEGMI